MCILWSVQFFVTFWDWTGSISWSLVKIKYHRLEVQSRIENINYKLPFLNNKIDFFCQTLDWLFPLSSNFRLIFRVQNHVLTKCTLFGPRPTNLLTTKAKTFECFKCGPAWSQYVQSLRSSPVCLDPPSSKVVLTLQCVPKPPSLPPSLFQSPNNQHFCILQPPTDLLISKRSSEEIISALL